MEAGNAYAVQPGRGFRFTFTQIPLDTQTKTCSVVGVNCFAINCRFFDNACYQQVNLTARSSSASIVALSTNPAEISLFKAIIMRSPRGKLRTCGDRFHRNMPATSYDWWASVRKPVVNQDSLFLIAPWKLFNFCIKAKASQKYASPCCNRKRDEEWNNFSFSCLPSKVTSCASWGISLCSSCTAKAKKFYCFACASQATHDRWRILRFHLRTRGETSINSNNFLIRDLYRCLVWLNVTARQSHLLNLYAEKSKFEFWQNHKFLAPSKTGHLTTCAWCALCCDFLGFCVQLQPNSASATDRRRKVPLDSKMQFREVLIGV